VMSVISVTLSVLNQKISKGGILPSGYEHKYMGDF